MPRGPDSVPVAAPAADFVEVPALNTPAPMVEANNTNNPELYALLADAARANEPRVRELIALAREALAALDAAAPEASPRAEELLERIEFGLGALLPPANIRISQRLANLISQSGRKKAA